MSSENLFIYNQERSLMGYVSPKQVGSRHKMFPSIVDEIQLSG
jgi:hypothetical protein